MIARAHMADVRHHRGGPGLGVGQEPPARRDEPEGAVPRGRSRLEQVHGLGRSWPSRCGCCTARRSATARPPCCSARWTRRTAVHRPAGADPRQRHGHRLDGAGRPRGPRVSWTPCSSRRSAPTRWPASAPATSRSPRSTTASPSPRSAASRRWAWCERGHGGAAARDGDDRARRTIPVNTSGGLKSKGHPVGATGIAQAIEIFEQLRGEVGRAPGQGRRIRTGPEHGRLRSQLRGPHLQGEGLTMPSPRYWREIPTRYRLQARAAPTAAACRYPARRCLPGLSEPDARPSNCRTRGG